MKIIPANLHQRPAGIPCIRGYRIGVALVAALLLASIEARAERLKLNFGGGGDFVSLAVDNPFGAPAVPSPHLEYTMGFSFILPLDANDLRPEDPNIAQWTTPGTAFVTANGVTVYYGGDATIMLYAHAIGYSVPFASFSLPGLITSFISFNGAQAFPDDHAARLLELGPPHQPYMANYVDVHSPKGLTVNDLDQIKLLSVETVPDSSVPDTAPTLFLFAPLAALLYLARRSIRRREG